MSQTLAPGTHIVTGAFGYTGKFIAQRLLDRGLPVATLTNSAARENPFKGRVQAYPLDFKNSSALAETLRGAAVLYNTYWVRFNCRHFNFAEAIRNSRTLFNAARDAGVDRIVHVSITNPSLDSPYEYFRGKAEVEEALRATGVPHAILRPAVLFGGADILINNIAWMLRRLPVFGVFGKGDYRVQPIHVEDFADLAIEHAHKDENTVVNAIGPETFTYREMVAAIAAAIGVQRPIMPVPAWFGMAVSRIVDRFTGDIALTWEEVGALMAGLLYVDSPPKGSIRLTQWARDNSANLGVRYANEIGRRIERAKAYEKL